jgi:hypothetical protein
MDLTAFQVGSSARDAAVSDGMCSIMDELNKSIEEMELNRRACDRVAAQCMSVAYDVVNMMYMARQTAPLTPLSMVQGSWEPELEPEPCSVERWNGGFLKVAVCRSPRRPICTVPSGTVSTCCSTA